jgi:hypothetical protein
MSRRLLIGIGASRSLNARNVSILPATSGEAGNYFRGKPLKRPPATINDEKSGFLGLASMNDHGITPQSTKTIRGM